MVKIFFSDSSYPMSALIRCLTWSEYSHVGFILNDCVVDSTLSHGGVRIRPLTDAKKNTTKFEVCEFPLVNDDAIRYAMSQVGKPYDFTAVLGLPFRRNWQEDDSWFCSELVAWACIQAGTPLVNKQVWRITPQDLFQTVR